MEYDAILFDNDGVLTTLTARDVLRDAITETFREFGVAAPATDHVEAMLGVTPEEAESICGGHGIDLAEFWGRRDANACRVQCDEIRAGRKVLYDDVRALESLSHDFGIVSNNQHETIEFIVDHFDLHDRFGVIYGREPTVSGIRRKKPNPHYLRRALDDLGADTALYVGDSDVDVAAAAAAGVDSAFLRRDHRRDYELTHEPTYELTSLEEVPALVAGE